jgi:hypothetical protein
MVPALIDDAGAEVAHGRNAVLVSLVRCSTEAVAGGVDDHRGLV